MKRLLSLTLFLALSMSLFVQTVHGKDDSYGLNDTAKAAELIQYNTPVPELIGNIIGTALSLISVVFFILAIYGGFRMMFARGKDDEFTKGKDILIHAIIGMIVILASYAITQFVFDSVKSGNDPNQKQPLSPECTVTADCKDTSLVCTDGKCVNKNGKEPGSVELGGACTATADCTGAGVTCTGNVCTAQIIDPVGKFCLLGGVCSPVSGVGDCTANSKAYPSYSDCNSALVSKYCEANAHCAGTDTCVNNSCTKSTDPSSFTYCLKQGACISAELGVGCPINTKGYNSSNACQNDVDNLVCDVTNNCEPGKTCVGGKCGGAPECTSNTQCTANTGGFCIVGKCDYSKNGGIGKTCVNDADPVCQGSELVCGVATKKCVVVGTLDSFCSSNSDCTGAFKCDTSKNTCITN